MLNGKAWLFSCYLPPVLGLHPVHQITAKLKSIQIKGKGRERHPGKIRYNRKRYEKVYFSCANKRTVNYASFCHVPSLHLSFEKLIFEAGFDYVSRSEHQSVVYLQFPTKHPDCHLAQNLFVMNGRKQCSHYAKNLSYKTGLRV